MKKLLLILLLFTAFRAQAQHAHYRQPISSNATFPATSNDTIVLQQGYTTVQGITTIAPIAIKTLVLPSNPVVGESVIVQSQPTITTVYFIGGTLSKPVTTLKQGQNLHLTFNKDGKWHW